MVLALLFWQFANEITRTRETKRFYPFFGLLGQQVALIGVGFLVQGLAEESWEASLKVMMMGIVIVGIRIIALYLFGVILIVTLAWLGVVKGALTAI